ncbi:hypothetical protein CsSME_00053149 [Camellia sinensis var. sinensis]
MAEMEEQRDGKQRIVGDGESDGDAMSGRQHCGDSESGATVYTSQGESQPHFVMGGNSIQVICNSNVVFICRVLLFTLPKVNHNLISSWVVILFSQVLLFILAKVNHNLVLSWVVILIRIMVLVSIFLNRNLVSSWVLIIIRIIVMIFTFLHLNLDLKFLWVVQVVLLLRVVHMM